MGTSSSNCNNTMSTFCYTRICAVLISTVCGSKYSHCLWIQIFSLSVVPNILTVCGFKYSHCLWFQIFSLSVDSNILTVCGFKYSHCLWFQIFSLSVDPNILTVCGFKYSHCLWIQIFSLSVDPNILTVCGFKYSHCLWIQIFSLSVVQYILTVCGPSLRTVGTKLRMKGTWAHRDTESTRCTGMKGTLGTAQYDCQVHDRNTRTEGIPGTLEKRQCQVH